MKWEYKIPDRHKFYPVRASNKKSDLIKWSRYAKKNYPGQKLRFIDTSKERFKTPELKKYWTYRMKAGYESRYMIYGNY